MSRPGSTPGIAPCTGCGYLTRPNRVRLAEAPGTRSRHGGGRCSACYGRKKRPADALEGRHEYTVAALGSFMARRNARLARLQRVTA